MGRFDLTLDDIEHTLLRPYFRDPRIHFAVNCASASCAPLPRWAFDGEDLDRQLDQRARLFLSDARNVRVEGETLDAVALLRLVRRRLHRRGMEAARRHHSGVHRALLTPEVAERLRAGDELDIEFFEYDWSLNAAVPPRRETAAGGSELLPYSCESSRRAQPWARRPSSDPPSP